MHANITRALRYSIYRRDGFRCALCDDTRGLQVHHITPRGRGGQGVPYNLICLCMRCHLQIHGNAMFGMPMPPAEIHQAAVEYVSDFYADDPAFYDWLMEHPYKEPL